MKKFLIVFLILLFIPIFSKAQTIIRDDFETNKLGWNEIVAKGYSAFIQDGKMHLETKENKKEAKVTCYPPIDVQKSFEIKAKLVDTKINDEERGIGLVFNYRDDSNYDAFIITKDQVRYLRFEEDRLVGSRRSDFKNLKKLKDHELVVKSSFHKMEFYVNNIKALEIRDITLSYSGFGLIAVSADDKQTADFDWIEFKQ